MNAAPTATPAKPCSVVGALVFGNFLAHHEDAVVGPHFLRHRIAQRFADRGRDHGRAGRKLGIGCRLGVRLGCNRRSGLGLGILTRRCFAFGSLLFDRRRGSGRSRNGNVVVALDRGAHGADRYALGPFSDENFADGAFVDGFEFHRRLVGLDLGKDVAGLHFIAGLHQPLGKRALLHRRGECGHLQFDGHLSKSPPARRYKARPRPARAMSRRSLQPLRQPGECACRFP